MKRPAVPARPAYGLGPSLDEVRPDTDGNAVAGIMLALGLTVMGAVPFAALYVLLFHDPAPWTLN